MKVCRHSERTELAQDSECFNRSYLKIGSRPVLNTVHSLLPWWRLIGLEDEAQDIQRLAIVDAHAPERCYWGKMRHSVPECPREVRTTP